LPRQIGVAIKPRYEVSAMPNRHEFRATTDQQLELIDEFRALEMRKRTVAMGSAEFVEIAIKTADQARLALRWAQMQLEMAYEAALRVESGEQPPDVHLVEVTPRPIDKVLADWREAQLRLEIARPGSPEAKAAVDAIEALREEYQRAHQATLAEQERR
jgi:hypothetical protein